MALSHRGHGLRIDAVGLSAMAPVKLAGPRGKRRRHIDHGIPFGNKLLGEQVAQTVRALDRPRSLGPVAGPSLEPGQGGLVRRHSKFIEHLSALIQREHLWGSTPIVITCASFLKAPTVGTAAGNLSSSKRFTPLSSHANGGR